MAALLGLESDIEVVAQAATGAEALAQARTHEADVAVLDLHLPDTDGVTLAEQLHRIQPHCRTMIVTAHGYPGHLKRALAAGVHGFLPKTIDAETLASVVRTVSAGRWYVDPQLAAEAISAGDSPLTRREAEVLAPAANDAPIGEIARRASLSCGTVRNYLSSAVGKLGGANRHEAARMARSRGWI
ncbi:two component transcriptional regulator, LuxR family [Actinoplanes regularis]|uniref:Two component transcriptional regulator, LuxR family n=2 Tax=Actinoplanes regularis TaxID=52697 RepID=A0A239D8A1_9ACTN|nr:DNA-binding response regulator [Actinoplanes regularis]SNS28402.1 two component transcriptional regulator, LuxR family [Actinoplanes regularis]